MTCRIHTKLTLKLTVHNIIMKWAQEDVETSYNLLNNNN